MHNHLDSRRVHQQLRSSRKYDYDLFTVVAIVGGFRAFYRRLHPVIKNLLQFSWSSMGSEQNDPSKAMDWKSIEDSGSTGSSDGTSAVKKRAPKRIRQIPEYYFLPRKSLPSAIMYYGSFIAGGIGAGMLIEVWLRKKAIEDARVASESNK